jgi:phosphatidylglycerol---prolipoprotein diacylglyceryl transferase
VIPVLFRFTFETLPSQLILYALALGIIAYVGWSGWRGTAGELDKKTQTFGPPVRAQQIQRALGFAALAAVIVYMALPYALPASAPFRGGKGEGLPIHAYGILLMLGFLSAVSLASKMAEREWLGEQGVRVKELIQDQLSLLALVGGVLGSRLLFVLVNWNEQGISGLFSLSGGLVFYGGLLGAIALSVWFARRHRLDFMRLADLCIPTVSLGQCLGRLGCFSAGCCWGDPARAHFPFAVHFPGAQLAKNIFGQLGGTSSLAYQSQAEDKRYVIEATGQVVHQLVPGAVRISDWAREHGHTLGLHPTQLYESLGQLTLFVLLVVMRRYRRFHGQIIGMWLMLYAVLRSSVELFRGDLERGTLHGLLQSLGAQALATKISPEAWYNVSTSQFISMCMFALGASILYRRGRAVMGAGTLGLAAEA